MTVWLNRAPVNALNSEMYVEIQELFGNLATYFPEARAIVLAGRGKHFCAGNDLAEFQSMNPENTPARMKLVREAFWAVYDAPIHYLTGDTFNIDGEVTTTGPTKSRPSSTGSSWPVKPA